jgi:hypothetical protein
MGAHARVEGLHQQRDVRLVDAECGGMSADFFAAFFGAADSEFGHAPEMGAQRAGWNR